MPSRSRGKRALASSRKSSKLMVTSDENLPPSQGPPNAPVLKQASQQERQEACLKHVEASKTEKEVETAMKTPQRGAALCNSVDDAIDVVVVGDDDTGVVVPAASTSAALTPLVDMARAGQLERRVARALSLDVAEMNGEELRGEGEKDCFFSFQFRRFCLSL